jgi:serine/threonine protein phosphatase PrpC
VCVGVECEVSSSSANEGLRIAWKSDVGTQRDGNEDVVVSEPELGLFAVIDGVGGEVAGERGAAEAAEILRRRLRRQEGSVERQVREAVALANNRLLELAQDDPSLRGMSCVLTVAVLRADELVVGHVGDTRLYLVLPAGLHKVTSDHSPVGQMEEMGELSEAEAMRHPRRNEIFRDVGSTWREPDDGDFLEIYREAFPSDRALLICSDGLTDQVPGKTILEVIRRCAGHPGVAVDELVRLANAAGGKDNVSVVIVEGEHFAERVLYAERSEDQLGDTRRLLTPEAAAPAVRKKVENLDSDPLPTQGSSPSAAQVASVRGAAAAKAGRGRVVASLAVLAVVLIAGWFVLGMPGAPPQVSQRIESWTRRVGLGPAWTLEVGAGRPLGSISEALALARAGDTLLVDDGTYAERLELRSRVTVRARNPRGALLSSGAESTMDDGVAVLAEGVQDARLEGFRIVVGGPDGEAAGGANSGGGARAALAVAVRLVNSTVHLVDLEISGATDAGVDFVGKDASVLARSFLRDHPGTCVRIAPTSNAEVVENLFLRCGLAGSRPAIDARAALSSVVRGNDFRANAIALWAGTRPLEEIQLINDYDLDPEVQVVSGPRLDAPAAATSSRRSSPESAGGSSP